MIISKFKGGKYLMSKITENLRKKVGLKIYNMARQYYLESVVGKLGKIVEDDDKITIYATQRLVEKNGKKTFYELSCHGMDTHYEESRKIVEKYKLNKPVYFVFDGIVFDNFVRLFSHFSNVIFKNCTFNNGLEVFYGVNVTLENNKYINWTDFYGYGDSFLYGRFDELTIKNDEFVNSYDLKQYGKTKFGINVSADKINIINSNICAESQGQINISVKEIFLVNSTIAGPEVYLDSESIKSSDSILKSDSGIMIDNKNSDFTGDVQAPAVIYNGVDLNAFNEVVSVNEDEVNLKSARYELLQKLRNLKDYCRQINEDKAHVIQEQLNSRPISRVLK